MVDMGKCTVSATFPHIIRKSAIKKKINKIMTVTTTTDRMEHVIFSDASKCSVEIVPCPQVIVITEDREKRNSSPRSTVYNDRPLHSLGRFGQQFISGVIRRLFESPASEKYGISTNNVYSVGIMLRNVCEWELPFELSEEVYLDNDNSAGTVAWRVHSRADQLWAGVEHSLDRWVADYSSSSKSSALSSGPILNGPVAIKLVEKIVHSTLWEMGIHSLRFDKGIDDEDLAFCDNPPGWTTPRAFGCCQCTPLESF